MALYEYRCKSCRLIFEQLISPNDPDQGKCPKCLGNDTIKLISRFWVAGQGDLRESTWNGCHEAHVGSDHDENCEHSTDHSDLDPPQD